MKKILSIALSLALIINLLSIAAISVSADDVVYSWPLDADHFTLSNNTTAGAFSTATSSDQYRNGTRFESGLSNYSDVGSSVTFTSTNTVEAGVYATALYGRELKGSTRAQLSIEINETQVADSINMNTTNTAVKNKKFEMAEITITQTSTIVMTVTVETEGNIYLNSLELTKTADYTPVTPSSPVTTDEAASIRLGAVNGIRFYTSFDQDAIDALNTEDEEVSYGTLVGPANLVGEELEIDDVNTGNAVDVDYTALEYWGESNNEFVGSIVNIKEANIGREFVGRGYVKIGDTYYYSETTSTRSLKGVATALQNDANNTALYEANKDLVDGWAAVADYVG